MFTQLSRLMICTQSRVHVRRKIDPWSKNRTYLEDSFPGQTDVIETDRTGEGILVGDVAQFVVLIPIDATVDRLMGILGQLAVERVEIEFTC